MFHPVNPRQKGDNVDLILGMKGVLFQRLIHMAGCGNGDLLFLDG